MLQYAAVHCSNTYPETSKGELCMSGWTVRVPATGDGITASPEDTAAP